MNVGSGKTLAFLLPITARLYQQKQQQQKLPELSNNVDSTETHKRKRSKVSTAQTTGKDVAPVLASARAAEKAANGKGLKGKASKGSKALLKGNSQPAKGTALSLASSQSAEGTQPVKGSSQSAEGRLKGSSQSAEGRLKGSSQASKGNRDLTKGPGAVVLAPSRELAAQTARCLLLLLKGLKLRCTLLTAAVAAGTDFTKVWSWLDAHSS